MDKQADIVSYGAEVQSKKREMIKNETIKFLFSSLTQNQRTKDVVY